MSIRDASYFDGWYRNKLAASALAGPKRHLGHPPELWSTSLLPLDGVREVAEVLALGPGRRLLDLACGTGGFGLWIARETGCDLVGVDFSETALARAREAVPEDFGEQVAARAEFRDGDLVSTGLPDASVDAVMVIDSIQFADGTAVTAECSRVLRPGGRIALTSWEPVDRGDEVLSERIRAVDLAGSLRAAGFTDVRAVERPQWLAAERAYWEQVVTLDPATHPGVASAVSEGRTTLANWGRLRRAFATATRPDLTEWRGSRVPPPSPSSP